MSFEPVGGNREVEGCSEVLRQAGNRVLRATPALFGVRATVASLS